MLGRLCNSLGVSGYEKNTTNTILQALDEVSNNTAYVDKVGNVVYKKEGIVRNQRIMICAHIDEVGFQVVRKINERKYRIKALGNIKTWNAFQQRVVSHNSVGIINAFDENNLKAHNFENLFIEVISDSIVNVGDVFTFDSSFYESKKYCIGKALDNRLACGILLDEIKANTTSKDDIYFVFTIQEEIGMRGIRYAKSVIKPDICIIIDTSPESDMSSLVIGKGVGIKISDSVFVSSPDLVDWMRDISDINGILYQMEVSDCGTNELIISNEHDSGYKELGISIPCQYPHTANTVVAKNDIQECKKLLRRIIAGL